MTSYSEVSFDPYMARRVAYRECLHSPDILLGSFRSLLIWVIEFQTSSEETRIH